MHTMTAPMGHVFKETTQRTAIALDSDSTQRVGKRLAPMLFGQTGTPLIETHQRIAWIWGGYADDILSRKTKPALALSAGFVLQSIEKWVLS
jgi:hypothetical protein